MVVGGSVGINSDMVYIGERENVCVCVCVADHVNS